MVKLKVKARVIPEDAYLSIAESLQAQQVLIRGEKRFYVIIHNPESWYIGTLANEIKRTYRSIYKHDLGEIKYLKDNIDDCDLDPEQIVLDALIDEGKALTDPSDQHVTIKVIQEQGRAVRLGSVVPDLSQVHYQLPERPVRPPVPTFQDVGPFLGKRKSEEHMPRPAIDKKRMRLGEIEEEGIIASIEDRPTHSDYTVPASQTSVTNRSGVLQGQSDAPVSPELNWSFDRIGPPTLGQPNSGSDQAGQNDIPQQPSRIESSMAETVVHQTPATTSRSHASPKVNGVPVVSPLAAASSASKKFLKPRMEMMTNADLEIDDSQMSPNSRDTSRITPRLVPSTKVNHLPRNPSKGDDDDDDDDASTRSSPTFAERIAKSVSRNSEQHQGRASSHQTRKAVDPMDHESTSSTSTQLNDKSPALRASISTEKKGTGAKPQPRADSTRKMIDPVQSTTQVNGAAPDIDGSLSDGSSISQSKATRKTRPRRRKNQSLLQQHDAAGVKGSPRVTGQSHIETPPSNQQLQRIKPVPNNGQDELSTPGPDSPSEQLLQTLQDSARKSIKTRPDLPTSKKGRVNETDEKPKPRNSVPKERKKRASNPANGLKSAATDDKSSSKTSAAIDRMDVDMNRDVMSKSSNNAALAVPSDYQAIRESSTDSRFTSSYTSVVPIGMSQEQYDQLVKGNAYLNSAGAKSLSQKKNTPSLQKTPSVEQSIGGGSIVSDKAKADNANMTPTPSMQKKTAAKSGTSTAKSEKETQATTVSKVSADPEPTKAMKAVTKIAQKSSTEKQSDGKSSTKTPSLAHSESVTSGRSNISSTKPPSIKPTSATTPAPLSSSKSATSLLLKPVVDKPSSQSKQATPTPTPSASSKVTSSTVTKDKVKAPPSSATKAVPPAPPSSSSVAKSSIMATPTPKPKIPSQAAVTKTTPTSNSTPTTNKPQTKPVARPAIRPTFQSARTLQELREMANSANTSQSNSPGPSTSRFAQPKKTLLNNDDTSSSSEASSSSSSTTPPPSRKATAIATSAASLTSKSKSKPTPKPKQTTKSSTTTAKPAKNSQPDPTIRDVTSDDSDE